MRTGQSGERNSHQALTLNGLWRLSKDSVVAWFSDDCARMGAALSFYTVFSLAPMLIIAIGIVGLVYGQDAARGYIVAEIQDLIGTDGAQAVQTMIKGVRDKEAGIVATLLGLVMLLAGATVVFAELQATLNAIWRVKPVKSGAVAALFKARLLSFAIVMGIGFLLLVSLAVSATLTAINQSIRAHELQNVGILFSALNVVISFAIITFLFAALFKFLPDAKIQWRDVWLGAIITTTLFTVGKYLIGLYLGHSGIASVYGAAGSLVVVMLWVYYSTQIVFFGAEFTRLYAHCYGSGPEPEQFAKPAIENITVSGSQPKAVSENAALLLPVKGSP